MDESPAVSIPENSKEAIHIYPNPSQGMITIESMGQESLKGIIVLDALGREIKLNGLVLTNDRSTLDLSTLPKGVYLIRILTEDKSYVQNFVLA